MKVYTDIAAVPPLKRPILTIGTFDGVHLGHQTILQRLKALSREVDGESILITFHPHPRMVIRQEGEKVELLNTLEEKVRLLDKADIDHLVIVPFSRYFSLMHPDDYVRDFIVSHLHPHTIVIGYDHRFGQDRAGGFHTFQHWATSCGYALEEISPQAVDDITVSSTKIRNALKSGQVEEAKHWLGYPYFIRGHVVVGQRIGHALGFPTANIEIKDEHKLIPVHGVYVIRAAVANTSTFGMLNIGRRPTFDGSSQTIEAHLFDFHKDIYGCEIEVQFLHYLREEQKFADSAALIEQLHLDRQQTLDYLKKSL